MKIVGVTGLRGLWALEWTWYTDEMNLHCAEISRISVMQLL